MIKKILVSIAALAFLLYAAYLYIALTTSYDGIYQKFHAQLADVGYEIKTESIDVVRFPLPRVVLGGVTVQNMFTAKSIEIKFSLSSMLKFSPAIASARIDDVTITLAANRSHFVNHETSVVEAFKLLPKLPEVTMYNVSLIDKTTKDTDSVKKITISPHASTDQLLVEWSDDTTTKMRYVAFEDSMRVQIDSEGPYHHIAINELYKNDRLEDGDIKYHISNLKEFIDHNFQSLDFLVTRIQSTETMDISCKIKAEGEKFAVSSIVLKSDSVSLAGNIDLYKSTTPDQINLVFNTIDLSKLLSAPNMDSVNESKNKSKLQLDDMASNINITAKKIIFVDAELDNLNFIASSDGKILTVKQFTGDIYGDGAFSVSGAVSQNQYRSIFDGNLTVKHKDANLVLSKLGFAPLATNVPSSLIFTSDVRATPIDYQLKNMFVNIGSFNIEGAASVKLIGTMPRVDLSLAVSSVDLMNTNYPIISPIVSYFRTLSSDMKAKDYLTKYIPLREIHYLGNFDIGFSDLSIGNDTVDKFRFAGDISSGNILLNSIFYQDNDNYVGGSGYLVSTGIKPELGIKITDAELSNTELTLTSLLTFLASLRDIYDLDKINITTELAAQSIKQGDHMIKNAALSAKNEGVLWNISSLGCAYAGGEFWSSGSLRVDPMTLNLSYAYNNFTIGQIQSILPLDLFGIEEGWISANGMISASGDSLAQLLYTLYTKSDFVAKNVKLDNLSLDTLITQTDNPKYQAARLDEDINYYIGNGTDIIQSLSGKIELNQGLFKASDLKFNTARIYGIGSAAYNIYDTKIGLDARMVFAPPMNKSKVQKYIPIGLKVTNTITAPKKEIKFDDFKAFLKQRKI